MNLKSSGSKCPSNRPSYRAPPQISIATHTSAYPTTTRQDHEKMLTLIINVLEFHRILPNVVNNFKPTPRVFLIAREQLVLKLNTAPRIPRILDKPTSIIINKDNLTTENETNLSTNETTRRNKVSGERFLYTVSTRLWPVNAE